MLALGGADVAPHAASIAAEASTHTVGDLILGAVTALWLSPRPRRDGRRRRGGGGGGGGGLPERAYGAYPAESAVALLANLAPHVKVWSASSAGFLVQILSASLRPRALYASEARAELPVALLEVLHLSLAHTHHTNHTLLRALLASEPLLQQMLEAPLPPPGAARPEWLTERWLAAWRARLPLDALFRAIEALKPRLSGADDLLLDTPPSDALLSVSLTGVLPPPPPIAVRRYQPGEGSRRWMTQVIWGLVYVRHQELFDARRVRLVHIMQVDDEA